jgi:ABC-type nitrate/sulfonate/bicarbonate transport system substrate-binding protein
MQLRCHTLWAYVAQQAGIKMIANLAKEDIPFMHIGLTTSRKWMRERRVQAKAFLRAHGKAMHFMHTRKEKTRAIFAKYTKINDQGMLDGSIQYGYDFMEKIPLVKPQAFQVIVAWHGRKDPMLLLSNTDVASVLMLTNDAGAGNWV